MRLTDKAAVDPGVRRERPFPVDPVAVAVAATEQAEAARLAYGRGEPTTGNDVHRGQQDRMLNSKNLREAVMDGHRSCSPAVERGLASWNNGPKPESAPRLCYCTRQPNCLQPDNRGRRFLWIRADGSYSPATCRTLDGCVGAP